MLRELSSSSFEGRREYSTAFFSTKLTSNPPFYGTFVEREWGGTLKNE
ncbi:hypothetical protein HMPREF3213_02135 [Heyndrickxia coagulans]|uniref:Uncharacterized protein n=1 Tax=Heyndrickxia coagulans TaxID=1398 RepID=A0A133KNN7_HEYCO|nr:hypothetical protein HMPREF3213_02135 [Heyndrickxia coagulans]